MTITDLAIVTGLGWGTVKDMVKKRLQKDYGAPRLKDLKHLSIDEIYLGRRRKYYTLVLDLDSGRIVWVANGRGGDALRKFGRARRCSRAKIKAVAMDMSAAYWAAVADNLPKAAIVFDRFHIVKLVNEKLGGNASAVNDVAVTPDGDHAVSGSDDTTLQVWDLRTGVALRTLAGHRGFVNAVALTSDG